MRLPRSLSLAPLLTPLCLAHTPLGCSSSSFSDVWAFNPVCNWREEPGLDLRTIIDIEASDPTLKAITRHHFRADQPWSYEPYCVNNIHSNASEPFCLYTSLGFANGRGISIITTPSDAKLIAETAAFQDADIFVKAGTNHVENPPFEARALPGRGIGLIANKTLQRGDRIFSHAPVIVVSGAAEPNIKPDDLRFLQRGAVARLPIRSRDMFFALHGHFGGDRISDIINTNAFDIKIGKSPNDHYAVLPETSRMNHDCRPNAHYYLEPDTLIHHVHVIRPIYPGEEITISYLDRMYSTLERKFKLKHTWGFDCNCSRCTQPAIFTEASDERLLAIEELVARLSNQTPARNATVADAEALVSLMEQERLYAVAADAYTFAALEYSFAGDAPRALMYAAKAVETGMLNGGTTGDDVKYMKLLFNNPAEHWSFKFFEKLARGEIGAKQPMLDGEEGVVKRLNSTE